MVILKFHLGIENIPNIELVKIFVFLANITPQAWPLGRRLQEIVLCIQAPTDSNVPFAWPSWYCHSLRYPIYLPRLRRVFLHPIQ